MAWPTRTADDVLSGDGAKTMGQVLYDRDDEGSKKGTTWVDFTDQNMTTTLADVGAGKYIRVPKWAILNTVMRLRFRAWRDAAVSGTANFRLRETGIPTNGGTLATTLANDWLTVYEVTLTLPTGWEGTFKNFALQAQRPASGVDANWQVGFRLITANLQFEVP